MALADHQLGLDLNVCNDHYLLQQMARIYHPVKIIHKEHDSISAFCINKAIIFIFWPASKHYVHKKLSFLKVSTGLMSVATQKELQELNISLLLNPSSWIEGMNDEADFDVLNLNELVVLIFSFFRALHNLKSKWNVTEIQKVFHLQIISLFKRQVIPSTVYSQSMLEQPLVHLLHLNWALPTDNHRLSVRQVISTLP